jgi:acyl-CoA dehydrogenase
VTREGQEPFTVRLEAFLAARARPVPPRAGWGDVADDVVGSALRPGRHEDDDLEDAREFQRALFDAGLVGPGCEGSGAPLARALARFETPDLSVFMIGQRIVAPAIARFGTDAQKERWLRAIWRGDAIACQLFSEPDAGSDLASLRCRAVRDGDTWRISGQKVWSSGAHVSDVGELLARTDDDPSSRHRGLSMFLVDMHAPGVVVRPLRQMNGNAHFNEVFLEDVVIPADSLLGNEGDGWAVANTSLVSERDLGPDDHGLFLQPVERLLELAAHVGVAHDPLVRQRLADAWARRRLANLLHEHVQHAPAAVAAVSQSLSKLYEAQSIWRIAQDAARILGPAVLADTDEWGTYAWAYLLLGVHSQRIAGGTDEIQRNIIGEQVLGLPKEPQVDRDMPFRDVVRNAGAASSR